MGRECRMVKEGWKHPKNERGYYIPLFEYEEYQPYADEFLHAVAEGGLQHAIDEFGAAPSLDEYMPEWTAEEKAMYMMYETTSEGTPISPAFKTAEELARWLTDNRVTVFADITASYGEWLDIILGKRVGVEISPGVIAI